MVIFYLIQNTSGAKGPLSAKKPRIRENQIFTSRTFPRLRKGLLKTPVILPEKHRLRANVRICAYMWIYIYMNLYVNLYVNLYMNLYLNLNVNLYVNLHMNLYVNLYVDLYMNLYVNICESIYESIWLYVNLYINLYESICESIYKSIWIYMWIYMNLYMDIYIYMNHMTETNTQTFQLFWCEQSRILWLLIHKRTPEFQEIGGHFYQDWGSRQITVCCGHFDTYETIILNHEH